MVIPIAFAIAAGAAVVKAKCAFMISTKNVAKQTNSNGSSDPWAMKVDLTSHEEKRKIAQAIFESSSANVANEKKKMQAQQEILQALEQKRLNDPEEEENEIFSLNLSTHFASGSVPSARATQRPLLCSTGDSAEEDSQISRVYFHQGLHITGTQYVAAVDSTNARQFFSSRTQYKVILVTELPETPGWFRQLASELRGECCFGETRCTDPLMMDLFGVSAAEPLPVVVLATDSPKAISYWKSKGLDLFSLGLVGGSAQAFCSGSMDPRALTALVRQAVSLPSATPSAERKSVPAVAAAAAAAAASCGAGSAAGACGGSVDGSAGSRKSTGVSGWCTKAPAD